MERLAEETVSNMLSRLPVKDLMRCKCVCKSWFDLITDPHFISNYYVFYNGQQQEHLLLIRKQSGISILSWNPKEPREFISSQVLNLPPYQYEWGEIMGPCNGIYFLQGIPGVIMNPSLRQYIALPTSHLTTPDGTYSMEEHPGFGFDPKTNDYKVVVLKDLYAEKIFKPLKPLIGEWSVELYSLNSNSWRNLGAHAIPFPFVTYLSWCGTYVNNCCHWWGYVYDSDEDESDDVENVILSFDMVSELFRKINVPKITYSSRHYVEKFVSFSESATIGLIAYPLNQGTEDCFFFDVWMMKDYWDEGSWIKQYSIGHLPVIYKQLVGFFWSSCFLWTDANDTLVLYDPHCEEHTRDLQIYGNNELLSAARYMESLVSLQRGN